MIDPSAIPLLLLCATCILPLAIGIGSYYLMIFLTNQHPVKDVTRFVDEAGREHVITETIRLTREEKKQMEKKEEQ